MNGFFLLLPFFFIRFGLLALLDKDALRRAAHFAPMTGNSASAYWVYQASNLALLVCPFVHSVTFSPLPLFLLGLAAYLLGLGFCAASIVSFGASSAGGLRTGGVYRFSRNPMYLSYDLFFLGCSLLIQSPLMLGSLVVFCLSSHWIILAEEQWCLKQFGGTYQAYLQSVRRYL